VSENLYRRESSGVYYPLLKRGRKQFRRSLKTADRALAKRRLNELREQIGNLASHDNAAITFDELGERWLATVRHTMKESTVARRKRCLKAVAPFFAGVTLRNITARHWSNG
jgi:uncharacterized metal-binding protein YceD (DUF177 family)